MIFVLIGIDDDEVDDLCGRIRGWAKAHTIRGELEPSSRGGTIAERSAQELDPLMVEPCSRSCTPSAASREVRATSTEDPRQGGRDRRPAAGVMRDRSWSRGALSGVGAGEGRGRQGAARRGFKTRTSPRPSRAWGRGPQDTGRGPAGDRVAGGHRGMEPTRSPSGRAPDIRSGAQRAELLLLRGGGEKKPVLLSGGCRPHPGGLCRRRRAGRRQPDASSASAESGPRDGQQRSPLSTPCPS